MPIEWTEDLNTNISEIDAQHREIFKRVNDLLDACGKGKGKNEVARLIAFLQDYVITHFRAEEAAMETASYPACGAHRAEHAQFISQIGELEQKLTHEGAGVHVVLLTIRTAVDWLVNHIRRTDRQFAGFANGKKKLLYQ